MATPSNYKFAKSHEWACFADDGTATIGLSDHAQNELGELVFINLPEVGDEVTAGEAFADVESVKAVSDIYSPVSGKVAAINEELLDAPEKVNSEPYDAWFVKVEGAEDAGDLLDAAAYDEFCASEE